MIPGLPNSAREVDAVAFVLDRSDGETTHGTRILSPYMANIVELWESTNSPFCVVVVQKHPERSAIMFAKDVPGLHSAVFRACDQLSGKKCFWNVSSHISAPVLRIVQADTGTAGCA